MNWLKQMRFRDLYMVIGSILVLGVWVLTDPDLALIENLSFGTSTIATLVILLKSVLYVALLHVSRKALFDYIDLGELYRRANNSPEGSGYVMIAISIAMVAISIVMFAATSGS